MGYSGDMMNNEIKSVSAAGGNAKIIHAAGNRVEPGCNAYFALCGDNRGIRRMMKGYIEIYLPVNCPTCLQKLAGK